MRKGISLLIIGLVVGSLLGFFYHSYKYELQLEAGSNWEAGQYIDSIIYDDVTNNVQVVCRQGNKQTFKAQDIVVGGDFLNLQQQMSIYFTSKDFDENGEYTGNKNFLLQRVCEIPELTDEEIDKWIEGEDTEPEPYFEVKLINS